MSLLPTFYSDWWEDLDRPHSIFDQHFGLSVDPDEIAHRSGILNRHVENLGYPFFRRMRRRYHPFHHALSRRHGNKASPSGSTDRDKFFVSLDVKQFASDEISVKTVDNRVVVVEAKHEEKEDEHGFISRQFTRKYIVPVNYDIDQIESLLSSDGILTITAPRKRSLGESYERLVKIQYTGEPAFLEQPQTKTVENQTEDFSRDHPQQRPGQMGQQQRGKKMNVKGM